MEFNSSPLAGNFVVRIERSEDHRGFFSRNFCKDAFQSQGLENNWKQINTSFSREVGTLRGLHFQRPPKSEVKLAKCLKGAIWDVVVDLRYNSETFGQWFAEELSDTNDKLMYVPHGFAHGFMTLQADSEILYCVSEEYSKDHEVGLAWDDPTIKIKWPMSPNCMSEKDREASTLANLEPLVF